MPLPVVRLAARRRTRPVRADARVRRVLVERERHGCRAPPTPRAPRARRASGATTKPVSRARGDHGCCARRGRAAPRPRHERELHGTPVEPPAARAARRARSAPGRHRRRSGRRATTSAARPGAGAARRAARWRRSGAGRTRRRGSPTSPAPRTTPLEPLDELVRVLVREARGERVEVVDERRRSPAPAAARRERRRHPTRLPRSTGRARRADGACAATTASAVDLPEPGPPTTSSPRSPMRTPTGTLPLPLGLVGEAEHQHVPSGAAASAARRASIRAGSAGSHGRRGARPVRPRDHGLDVAADPTARCARDAARRRPRGGGARDLGPRRRRAAPPPRPCR